jgi:hypothetical protein
MCRIRLRSQHSSPDPGNLVRGKRQHVRIILVVLPASADGFWIGKLYVVLECGSPCMTTWLDFRLSSILIDVFEK